MNKIELLNYAVESGILDLAAVHALIEMDERQKYLDMHQAKIWQGTNGKWYTRLPGRKLLKKTRKEDLEEEVITYYRGHDNTPTVTLIFNKWIQHKLDSEEIGKGTFDRYNTEYLRFIGSSYMGKRDIRQVDADELECFIKTRIKELKLTAKAYGNMRTLINGIWKYARKNELEVISISEFFGDISLSRRLFTVAAVKYKKQVYMEDEVPKVIKWLKEHPSVSNYGVILDFYTGIREGELSALKFSDVNGNVLHVRRMEIKYKNGAGSVAHDVVDYTKTEAGERDVILTKECIEIIEKIREMNPNSDFMMVENGRRVYTNTFNDRIYRACDALGIERRSMHKIRKTYGTKLLDGGVNDSVVMEMMGHANIETTRKHYYYSNKTFQNKVDQIERAIVF